MPTMCTADTRTSGWPKVQLRLPAADNMRCWGETSNASEFPIDPASNRTGACFASARRSIARPRAPVEAAVQRLDHHAGRQRLDRNPSPCGIDQNARRQAGRPEIAAVAR
jgi:hypothetical protein